MGIIWKNGEFWVKKNDRTRSKKALVNSTAVYRNLKVLRNVKGKGEVWSKKPYQNNQGY